jgi:DNA-binding response OmpR family regulator
MAEPTNKILIAEDDDFLATLLRSRLMREGFPVTIVRSGDDVLSALKKEKPSLLILDIILPGKSGFEILEELAARNVKAPFMILSNLGQAEDIERAKSYGAIHYFVKSSVNLDDLVTVIRSSLAKKS